jgi:4-hydroxy-3-methylbut-2-enyl diphosphate reductase
MKKFEIPQHFRSSFTGKIKQLRRTMDPRKKDWTPTNIPTGKFSFVFPRHMGFCYGVENAIEIAYKAIHENPGKRIFLLGEMIHNPAVNEDLLSMGVRFIMDTEGRRLVDWGELNAADIVITPAFGTTLEIAAELEKLGVDVKKYNTTCPFVEKVWKRSHEIGEVGYTIVIHGKYKHEETRATFSHAQRNAKSVIIRDMKEAQWIADFVEGRMEQEQFLKNFAGKCSENFDPNVDFQRIGVVNQTTMLASETEEIAAYLKQVVQARFGADAFADTRDTLCYATNENQMAVMELLQVPAELSIVIGGHKSSNTFQLATILNTKMKTYFIEDASAIAEKSIRYLDLKSMEIKTDIFDLTASQGSICVVSGASCPDTIVDEVVSKICEVTHTAYQPDLWLEEWSNNMENK